MTRSRLVEIHRRFDRERPAPCMEGFAHVAEAANDSITDILRHVRREAHGQSSGLADELAEQYEEDRRSYEEDRYERTRDELALER